MISSKVCNDAISGPYLEVGGLTYRPIPSSFDRAREAVGKKVELIMQNGPELWAFLPGHNNQIIFREGEQMPELLYTESEVPGRSPSAKADREKDDLSVDADAIRKRLARATKAQIIEQYISMAQLRLDQERKAKVLVEREEALAASHQADLETAARYWSRELEDVRRKGQSEIDHWHKKADELDGQNWELGEKIKRLRQRNKRRQRLINHLIDKF